MYATRPKHENCTYAIFIYVLEGGGGVEVVLNLSFVWNFFINHILQSPFVHLQSPFMVFEWKYIIVLCLIIPPPLSDKSDQNSTYLCCTWQSKRNLWKGKPWVFKQQRIMLLAPLSGDLWPSSCREWLVVSCVLLSGCVR